MKHYSKFRQARKQWGQAQQTASKLQTAFPKEGVGYYLSGLAYQAEGALDKSAISFEQAVDKQPETVEPLAQMVKTYLAMKQPGKALSKLNALVQNQPKNFLAYNLMGGVYASDKKFDEAIKAYQAAIKIKPDWPTSYRDMAMVYLAQKNKDQAIKALTTGIAETKGALQLVSDLGLFYKRDGDHQKAVTLYEDYFNQHPEFLDKQSESAEFLAQLVNSYLILKQPDKALAKLNEVVQKKPNHFFAQNLIGGVYASEKKYDDAANAYLAAIKTKADWPNSYRDLAMVYLKNNNKDEAVKILTKGIAETKGSIDVVSNLAMLHNRDGDHQKAIAVYEESYKQHPDSLLAVNNLASYLSDYALDTASLERAAKMAEPLEKTNNGEMLDTVGWIAYRQENYEKALDFMLRAVKSSPNSAVSHYHLGMVYFKKGDKAQAREYLEKVVNSKADFIGLTEAKETLKSISEGK